MALNFARHGSKIILRCAGPLSRHDTSGVVMRLARTSQRMCRNQSTAASPTTVESEKSHVSSQVTCYATRSHTCGELTRAHVGSSVCLKGWLQSNRSKFLILRDAYGVTQILLENLGAEFQDTLDALTLECVIEIRGVVSLRPENQISSNMKTGEVEVIASHIKILGPAPNQMPLQIRKSLPTENLRMKYRYLYLRYPHMQKVLRLRSQFIHTIRNFLIQKNFVDVETPTLFRKTPGGAQEFIVATQIPGHFYSLVQSPQQFKQLLMIGGLDRYFQIARCYRDETVRYDRQPEFTQLDIELSFVDREGVISLIEDLIKVAWPPEQEQPLVPFPRMTYQEAMEKYGSDKPDLQFNIEIQNVTHLMQPQTMKDSTNNFSGRILVFPGAANVCKKDQLNKILKAAQSGVSSTNLRLIPVKSVKELKYKLGDVIPLEKLNEFMETYEVTTGSLLAFCLGPDPDVLKVLGSTRTLVADALEGNGFSVRAPQNKFLWVVDFPLFEEGDNGSLQSAHHPFTQPHPDDLHLLETEPLKVRGLHYDLVLNGAEIGGGSIRISDATLQKHILHDLLGVDTSTLQHLLDALSLGSPPHGGIALGLDRLVSIISGVKSLREVIAFPKGLDGKDLMSGAPAFLTDEDAKTYKIPKEAYTKENL